MHSVILNPKSGNGLSLRTLPSVEALLSEKRVEFRVDEARGKGDIQALAAKAVSDGLSGIVVLGGDGSFFEAANGVRESGLEMLFVPCGTGNDMIKSLNIPRRAIPSLKAQLESPPSKLDMGRCNDMYFLNVAGTGFDVDVLYEAEKYKKHFGGLKAYMLGAYTAIKHFKPMNVEISVDGDAAERVNASIISIGNGKYIGGGMKAVPDADPTDGIFDVVICRDIKKREIPYLLLSFVAGKHAKNPKLSRVFRCRRLRIVGEGAMFEYDGEIYPCPDADFELLPGALNVRIPATR